MKLIDKDALVAKIERLYNRAERRVTLEKEGLKAEDTRKYEDGLADAYDIILSFINTLEVKEVDFEKELDRIWFDNKLGNYFDNDALDFAHVRTMCKHFFELGIAENNKAQKGE